MGAGQRDGEREEAWGRGRMCVCVCVYSVDDEAAAEGRERKTRQGRRVVVLACMMKSYTVGDEAGRERKEA